MDVLGILCIALLELLAVTHTTGGPSIPIKAPASATDHSVPHSAGQCLLTKPLESPTVWQWYGVEKPSNILPYYPTSLDVILNNTAQPHMCRSSVGAVNNLPRETRNRPKHHSRYLSRLLLLLSACSGKCSGLPFFVSISLIWCWFVVCACHGQSVRARDVLCHVSREGWWDKGANCGTGSSRSFGRLWSMRFI